MQRILYYECLGAYISPFVSRSRTQLVEIKSHSMFFFSVNNFVEFESLRDVDSLLSYVYFLWMAPFSYSNTSKCSSLNNSLPLLLLYCTTCPSTGYYCISPYFSLLFQHGLVYSQETCSHMLALFPLKVINLIVLRVVFFSPPFSN